MGEQQEPVEDALSRAYNKVTFWRERAEAAEARVKELEITLNHDIEAHKATMDELWAERRRAEEFEAEIAKLRIANASG
jgi:hypothetical protein